MILRELLSEHLKKLTESKFAPMAQALEKILPHECRYKTYEVNSENSTVWWITQESSESQGKDAARTIADYLTARGYTGFSVLVTIRDEYTGDEDTTQWQGVAFS